MTHEQIAIMLGVRRESVTQAALKLQTAGAIRYSRGHITVFEREELEKSVCECYSVVNSEYERLLWTRHANPTAVHVAERKASREKERWSVNCGEPRTARQETKFRPPLTLVQAE
jgi:hypothetical protein